MTLREVVDEIGIDKNPLGCAFLIASFLRTFAQGEVSTFEGECASLLKLHELTGREPDKPETIRWWLRDLGKVPDIDVSDKFWMELARADHDDNVGG